MSTLVVVRNREINVEDVKNMAKYGSLLGRRVYQIKSTKIDEKDPESSRLYGIVSTPIVGFEYISTKEAGDGVPKIILNPNDKGNEIILPVSTDPFKTIDKVAAMKRGFIPEEGYYTNREDAYGVVNALNAARKAEKEAEIAKLTADVEVIEAAMDAEAAGLFEEIQLEKLVNA